MRLRRITSNMRRLVWSDGSSWMPPTKRPEEPLDDALAEALFLERLHVLMSSCRRRSVGLERCSRTRWPRIRALSNMVPTGATAVFINVQRSTERVADQICCGAVPHQRARLEPLQVEGLHVELRMHLRIGGEEYLKPPVEAEAVDHIGSNTPADAVRRLDNHDIVASGMEHTGRRQASEPGTHHNNVSARGNGHITLSWTGLSTASLSCSAVSIGVAARRGDARATSMARASSAADKIVGRSDTSCTDAFEVSGVRELIGREWQHQLASAGCQRFLHAVVATVVHAQVGAAQHGHLRELRSHDPVVGKRANFVERCGADGHRHPHPQVCQRLSKSGQHVAAMRQKGAERHIDLCRTIGWVRPRAQFVLEVPRHARVARRIDGHPAAARCALVRAAH